MNNSVTIEEIDLRVIDKVKRDAKEKGLVPISYKFKFKDVTWYVDVKCYATNNDAVQRPVLIAKYVYNGEDLKMRLVTDNLLEHYNYEMA